MKFTNLIILTMAVLVIALCLPAAAAHVPHAESPRITYSQHLTPHHDVTLTEYRQIVGTAKVWSQWSTTKPWNWDKINVSDKQQRAAVLHYMTDTITETAFAHVGRGDTHIISIPYSFSLKHSIDSSQLDWTALPKSDPWVTTHYSGFSDGNPGKNTIEVLRITVLGSITTQGKTYRYTPILTV